MRDITKEEEPTTTKDASSSHQGVSIGLTKGFVSMPFFEVQGQNALLPEIQKKLGEMQANEIKSKEASLSVGFGHKVAISSNLNLDLNMVSKRDLSPKHLAKNHLHENKSQMKILSILNSKHQKVLYATEKWQNPNIQSGYCTKEVNKLLVTYYPQVPLIEIRITPKVSKLQKK